MDNEEKVLRFLLKFDAFVEKIPRFVESMKNESALKTINGSTVTLADELKNLESNMFQYELKLTLAKIFNVSTFGDKDFESFLKNFAPLEKFV